MTMPLICLCFFDRVVENQVHVHGLSRAEERKVERPSSAGGTQEARD